MPSYTPELDMHESKHFLPGQFVHRDAACPEYFIFFSIDSSEARKQYDEYCLSIMQTITYAYDRTHFQGTGCIVHFELREWN